MRHGSCAIVLSHDPYRLRAALRPDVAPAGPGGSAEGRYDVGQPAHARAARVNPRRRCSTANVAYWMYAIGVDRMHMTSEKHFTGGTAVMEIDCNRANPDTDQFTITVLDERGRTTRRERYSRAEVEESSRMLRGISNIGPTELRAMKVEWHATIQVTQCRRPARLPARSPWHRPVNSTGNSAGAGFSRENRADAARAPVSAGIRAA